MMTQGDTEETGGRMASREAITSQPGKTLSTSGLPMEGWLDINTDCESGTDMWDTTNLRRRYCKLQRCGDSLSLEVYRDEKKAELIDTLSLFNTTSKDTARNAAKMGRVQVVAEDGRVLCVMKDDERVSEWVVSLNSVIKRATSDTVSAQGRAVESAVSIWQSCPRKEDKLQQDRRYVRYASAT